ncbi:MAG: OmpA family protein [Hyphomicrobium sp.]
MSASLMEALQGLVTPALLKTASSTLGESEGALTAGLGAVVSKILGALVSGATDQSMMNSVAGMVSAHSRDPGLLSDVSGLLTGSMPSSSAAIAGNQLIGSLFGVKEGGIAQSAAAAAGLKPQSGASLMALAGPLVLGALSKTPGAGSLTGTALSALLNSERGALLGAIAPAAGAAAVKQAAATVTAAPAAAASAAASTVKAAATSTTAQVATAATAAAAATAKTVSATAQSGASTAAAAAPATRGVAAEAVRHTAAAGGAGMSWLLWFVPLLLLGGLGWFMWQTQHSSLEAPAAPAVEEKKAEPKAAPVEEKKAEAPAPAAAPAPAPEPAPAVAADAGNGMMKLALPGGESIMYATEGIEGKLLNFLQDANSVIDKKTWFDFDRLNFETGSTTLTAESKDQVSNIAAILKAFPTAAVKIGGYTDNVGEPESNLKLSDERAKKVMSELAGLGIAADRLEAEGYGEQFPIASNDEPEGRAKNRRTALSVRAR